MSITFRKRLSVITLFAFLASVLTIVHVTKNYDLRDHKWMYSYVKELPNRNSPAYRRTRPLQHAWQPGANFTLVDPYEPYLKSHHDGRVLPTKNFYQILHYNEEANNHAAIDNKIIKQTCAYQNCLFTNNRTLVRNSSAVIYALSHGKIDMAHALSRTVPGQIWIVYDREPPVINGKFFYRHASWQNAMNWSWSYRLDSDIVYPYGVLSSRDPAHLKTKDYTAIYKKKTKFAFWMVSNCGMSVFSRRENYVKELKKYIPVDVYGKCGTPIGRDKEDVDVLITQYKFYLAFENSFCHDYMTEKAFHLFNENVLMVVRGGFNYDKHLPGETFINAGKFPNASSLAQYLIRINQSEHLYTNYLRRKDKYSWNGTLNWQCQMCAKLNNQERYQNVYESIVSFWNVDVCWAPSDVPNTWWIYCIGVLLLIVAVVLVLTLRMLGNFLKIDLCVVCFQKPLKFA